MHLKRPSSAPVQHKGAYLEIIIPPVNKQTILCDSQEQFCTEKCSLAIPQQNMGLLYQLVLFDYIVI